MKKKIVDSVLLLIGIIVYCIGIHSFAVPHKIAPGGASGIAVLFNHVTEFPIGLFVLLFNIPLLLVSFIKRYFTKGFFIKTTIGIFLLSFIMDYIVIYIPIYKGEPLLATIFAGILTGIGLAFVHLGNSNTGGISLLGVIIQKKHPQFQVGFLISSLNMLVVAGSGIVYRNIESMLYSILIVYLSGAFMDKVLFSVESKNLMIVISECTDKTRCVFVEAKKGITILKGEGGYTSETQRVIIGAINKSDCYEMKKRIEQVDPNALIIITEGSKVSGKIIDM